MTRWLGAGFSACEGQACGGNGHGKECRYAQVAGDVAQHGEIRCYSLGTDLND